MKTLVKKVGGVEIFHEDGKFYAKIGDDNFRRTSVGAIEKLINSKMKSIKLMVIRDYPDTPHAPEYHDIIGMRGDRGVLINGKALNWLDYIYDPTPEQVAAVNALVKEQIRLTERWERTLRKIKHVSDKNFAEVFTKHTAK